jgi:hypothetical protein
LTLNPATGAITGTPTSVGTFTFTASVTDASGRTGYNTAVTNCSIIIGAGYNTCGLTWGYWKNHLDDWPVDTLIMGGKLYTNAELLNLLNLPVAGDASLNLAHQLIAAKLNVFNGTNQLTDGGAIAAADALLASYSGKLPLGVSTSQMTTIAAQLDTFNQDGLAQPGCSNGPAPMTLTCAASTGQVGAPYSSAMFVTGGLGPYTFSVVSGSLPPGLTLNPDTGAIKGTPTTAGTYSFTVRVADSTSYDGGAVGTITKSCSITISAPPTNPTATCISITAVQGVAITPVTMTASGGVAPYTFTASGLPSGLTMSTTGTISGTPAVSGTFSYTVTVKDANKNTGTLTCTVRVDPPPTGPALSTGDTATIGYWNNKNGQALILACNGSAGATQLGTWLASNFPVLFGPSSSSNMTGKTNTQVAALFKTFFSVKGTKTNAQVMAGALAIYVTNSALAGTAASKYGFNLSTTGTGAKYFNVGSNGAAVGLTNNTSYSIMRLLQNANAVAPYDANEFNALNVIFTAINETGDIK